MSKMAMNESDKIKGKNKMDGDDSYKSIMLSHKECPKCRGKKCSCKGEINERS